MKINLKCASVLQQESVSTPVKLLDCQGTQGPAQLPVGPVTVQINFSEK